MTSWREVSPSSIAQAVCQGSTRIVIINCHEHTQLTLRRRESRAGVSFMMHCDIGMRSQNQPFQSTLSIRREGGGLKKDYSVYGLDNVDNSG